MAFNFPSIFGGPLGGLLDGAKTFAIYILPLIIIGIIIVVQYRNRTTYKFRARVFRIRENGTVKESNFKAGYIGRQNSGQFFRMKTGKMWWQHIDLITTPAVRSMDIEDRIYYLQTDVGTFRQMKRELDLKTNCMTFTPMETDVKYSAILSIKKIKDVMTTETTWQKVWPHMVLILLAIIFIVAYITAYQGATG